MKICVVGGAGYVGTELVASLIGSGHDVTVLDKFWFGDFLPPSSRLTKFKGDIRNKDDLRISFRDQDAVIHLACISNDPSFDMNPHLGESINHTCFKDCLAALREAEVKHFVYASSSSVYGVSDLKKVTEDSDKNPLTDYSKFKLRCEEELMEYGMGGAWTILRPATVCGFSRRQRLDLVVNILTMQALIKKKITIFGRSQKRPNINIQDMVSAYEFVLGAPTVLVDRCIFNVGFENLTLYQIANLVRSTVGGDEIDIEELSIQDSRSYHICSDKILKAGFHPLCSIDTAILSLKEAHKKKRFKDPMTNPAYYNIKQMKELRLV